MPTPDHSTPTRLFVAAPGENLTRAERQALEILNVDPETVDGGGLPDTLPEGGGWIVLSSSTSLELMGEVIAAVAETRDPWALLRLQPTGGPQPDGGGPQIQVLPISPGYLEEVDRVAERLEAEGLDPGYLSHRRVLLDLSRVRHDVNNALTSALAETQFMQMDNEPGTELAEGLAVVEDQLRKIRDLMAELTVLRVSSR